MIIHFQGQLGVAAETTSITKELTADTSVAALITAIAADLPSEARALILTPDGALRSSLFIALDDTHLRDTTTLIPPNTQSLTLMPPMAGG